MTEVRVSSMFLLNNDAPTADIYTLSLHDALPIFHQGLYTIGPWARQGERGIGKGEVQILRISIHTASTASVLYADGEDRKSTRLNSVTCQSRMPSSA